MRHTFNFDGVQSSDYGVYISGSGTFDAPERDFEAVEIPGRNGILTLDNGRYQLQRLKYPAFVVPPFRDNVRGLRNALMSKRGAHRLTDTYNPDEFYLAYYERGLEVDPEKNLAVGAMDIIFTRDPRRFLLSGETPVELGAWGQTETDTGDMVSIDNDGTQAVKSLTVDIEPIQAGSGDPSPTNVRTISGTDSVNAVATGTNVLPKSVSGTSGNLSWTVADDGTITVNGTASSNTYFSTVTLPVPIPKNTPFRISAFNDEANSAVYIFAITDIGTGNPQIRFDAVNKSAVFTKTDNTIVKIRMLVNAGTYSNFVFRPMVSIGNDTVSAYSPYAGQTYTTALGRTVYGGTLDIVSGELTVTDALIASYSGETLPSTWISDRDVYAAGRTPTTGAQVVYTLATPEVYSLTPAQVDLLLGENHVWSDAGAVSVEYGTRQNAVVNPTLFASRPVIRVYGHGTLTVGDVTVAVAQNPYEYIDIDSEMMDCYHVDDNANSYVSFSDGEFPTLPAGTTTPSYSGSITKVIVTPHWWRL